MTFLQFHPLVYRNNRHYSGNDVPSLSPDNDVFVSLAHLYADNHKTMKGYEKCGDRFEDGITNGANWYNVRGTYKYMHKHIYI